MKGQFGEPWQYKQGATVWQSDSRRVAIFELPFQAARAFQCVNDMDGIDDPAKLREVAEQLRDVVERFCDNWKLSSEDSGFVQLQSAVAKAKEVLG